MKLWIVRTIQTLQLKLSADLEATRRRITIEYILPADDLHRLALKRRFQLSICRLLTSAALGFIAEIDIKNYTKHEAVMDLLATSPSFLLVDPIARSFRELFILLYKEAHKLKFVPPSPTIECKVLTDVLKEINGHEPRQTRIMEDTPIENTTEKTNTTFDNNTTKTIDLHADTDSTSSITATTTRTSTTEEQPLFDQ